jgi:DNA-binding MarR family transcriptional regulator
MPPRIPEAAVAEFAQAIGLLVRRLRAATAPNDLSLTENTVLARLAREGAATTAELARAEGMKPQSMGTTVAALEAMGLVARKAHPTDGRQRIIELTTRGQALRKSTIDNKRSWLAEAMLRLDDEERATLLAAGRIIRRMLEP